MKAADIKIMMGKKGEMENEAPEMEMEAGEEGDKAEEGEEEGANELAEFSDDELIEELKKRGIEVEEPGAEAGMGGGMEGAVPPPAMG